MKVKELIAKLEFCDPEAMVVTAEGVGGEYWYWEVESISEKERDCRQKTGWDYVELGNSVLVS